MYVQGYDYDRSLKAEQPDTERSSGGEVVGQRGHHQEERSSGGEGVRQRLEVITLQGLVGARYTSIATLASCLAFYLADCCIAYFTHGNKYPVFTPGNWEPVVGV